MHAAPSGYDYSPYPGKSLPPSPGDRHGSPPSHAPALAPAHKKAAPPTTAPAPANSATHGGHAAPVHGPAASGATALSQCSPVLVLFLAAVALKQHI